MSDGANEGRSDRAMGVRRAWSWRSQSLRVQAVRSTSSTISGPTGTSSEGSQVARIRELEVRILAGQTALRSMRLRVSGTMLGLGVGCACLAQLGYHSDEADQDGPWDGAAWFASIACMVLLAFAPLADDWVLTLVVAIVNASISTVGIDMFWNVEALFTILRRSDESFYEDGCDHPALDHPRTYCIWKAIRREASARFCCISLGQLTYADSETNAPSVLQARLAMPSKLGLCDAFISHSWHDSAVTKWDTLQEWRNGFVAQNGREPKVWFDKCCIDQGNIDADLRCLPVFLSGCQKLVVLCGVTYLSRLWCIMELFIFVHMGGDPKDIELHLLLRAGRKLEDRGMISAMIESFDAGMCTCANDSDRDRMLEIIHTAYGELDEFNKAVRTIIERTCSRYVEYSDLISGSSSDSDGFSSDGSDSSC
ncbi:unnamed protein product [Prorocentrum cordatum]|uniref:Heterokaryon incompatibility domain-containing protein n=1 Tax=Prorocentrum cordatum TaxID=2364126 RepID=A0ABN9Q338_9DINO|nr:unnamed protein product [Polarella glacialis]